MSGTRDKAVVLLSGGLDSTTALAIANHQGFQTFAISFNYSQRHSIEIDRAKKVAKALGVERHLILDIDLRSIGGSALTNHIPVPKDREAHQISSGIPVTYVPARNTIFLSYAIAWAEVLSAQDIFIGVNALDYSGYPDCRPEYIAAFETMANLATKAGIEGKLKVKIHTPLIAMSKAEIIRTGLNLRVDYSLTHSCYDPTERGIACGRCDSCLLRLKGFAEAGATDPLRYQR
jgi:7-cyano-7-deazaguanine synthase